MVRNPEGPTLQRTGQTNESAARKPVAGRPAQTRAQSKFVTGKDAGRKCLNADEQGKGRSVGKMVRDIKETKGTSKRQIK